VSALFHYAGTQAIGARIDLPLPTSQPEDDTFVRIEQLP